MGAFGAIDKPFAGQKKNYAAQVGKPIKPAVLKPVTPAVPAAPSPGDGVAATPAVPASPYAKPLAPGTPPSMTNIPANPKATGQATAKEIAGLTLEQWRNVQRALGIAPSV